MTYAALNNLDLFAADIKNAYLQAPITEKYYTLCGPEFGPELHGNVAYIVRALYGTKCAGRDFRNHLRECMDMLGYISCTADPDLWMRKATKDEKGNLRPHYKVLCPRGVSHVNGSQDVRYNYRYNLAIKGMVN